MYVFYDKITAPDNVCADGQTLSFTNQLGCGTGITCGEFGSLSGTDVSYPMYGSIGGSCGTATAVLHAA
jgi:hypothetical protein